MAKTLYIDMHLNTKNTVKAFIILRDNYLAMAKELDEAIKRLQELPQETDTDDE